MLFPKKVKFRRWQKMRSNPKKKRIATRGATLSFGSFGLQTLEPYRVKSNHIEASRKVMARYVKKTGQIWIRIFPDMPVTAKPAEVGMGKGKGDLQHYVSQVWPGTILFEVDGLEESVAREVLRKAGTKMPMKTKIISR